MSTTFKPVLEQPRADGTYLLMIRITHNRQIKRVGSSTPRYYLRKEDFNPENPDKAVRKSYHLHKQANAWLEQTIIKGKLYVAEMTQQGKPLTVTLIQEYLQGKAPLHKGTFHAFVEQYTQESEAWVLKQQISLTYRNAHLYCINNLKAFKKGKDFSFQQIDRDFAEKFYDFVFTITKTQDGKKLHFNTAVEKVRIAGRLFEHARGMGYTSALNPFNKLAPSRRKSLKKRLTVEEIERIGLLEYPVGSLARNVKNLFLLCFYTAGTRLGDMLMMRRKNIEWKAGLPDRLIFTTIKDPNHKGGKHRSVKLSEQAAKILLEYAPAPSSPDGFLFPFMPPNLDYSKREVRDKAIINCNSSINRKLAEIVKAAGIDKKVTMHLSRHSFAFVARQITKDVKLLSDMLGHESLVTTQIYLDEISHTEQDAAMDQIFPSAKQQ